MTWRVGNHYGIHVYEDQRPVATFHREQDARRCVDAVNGVYRSLLVRIAELEAALRKNAEQNADVTMTRDLLRRTIDALEAVAHLDSDTPSLIAELHQVQVVEP